MSRGRRSIRGVMLWTLCLCCMACASTGSTTRPTATTSTASASETPVDARQLDATPSDDTPGDTSGDDTPGDDMPTATAPADVTPADSIRRDAPVTVTPPAAITHVERNSYTLQRGVIVTLDRAYVLGAESGIDAIDLIDNRVIWHSDQVQQPLYVIGDRLIATGMHPHALLLLVLHATHGAFSGSCGVIDLPAWAQTSPVDGLGSSFDARIVGPGHLSLRWTATTEYVGGVAPTERMRASSTRRAQGAALLRMPDCRVVHAGPTHTATKLDSYGVELPYVAGPFKLDGVLVTLDFDEAEARVFRRDVRGRELSRAAFTLPANFALVSSDHRHLLIVDALGEDGAFHSAQLVSTVSGRVIASVPFGPIAPSTFIVQGPRVVYATDTELRVVDYVHPDRSFARPLRSTRYDGPLPPTAARPGLPQRPAQPDQ